MTIDNRIEGERSADQYVGGLRALGQLLHEVRVHLHLGLGAGIPVGVAAFAATVSPVPALLDVLAAAVVSDV